jgi:prophage regulatory protein
MSEYDHIAFWRFRELRRRVPFGRTTIWAMCREGRFPQPYKIGKTAVAWRSDEIEKWIGDQKISEPKAK